MIGKIGSGKSSYHLIRYCLEDKKDLTEEQKEQLMQADGLQHKDRAEVLEYNLCFGDTKELIEQFREVERLSNRVEKPVFHISLRLAPGEQLTTDQWREIGRECAKEFGLSDHQYMTILHKDAAQPHIHLVANRVGYDGKAVSDSNSYRRMADFCRRIEKQYGIKEILSPRAFQTPQQRQQPRQDARKEKLHSDIKNVLSQVRNYPDFERRIKALGYGVIKARGISFIDDKKVKTKGSEVGFSLATIEKILAANSRKILLDPPQPQHRNQQREHDHNGEYEPTHVSKEENLAEQLADILMRHDEEYVAPNPFKKKPKKGISQ